MDDRDTKGTKLSQQPTHSTTVKDRTDTPKAGKSQRSPVAANCWILLSRHERGGTTTPQAGHQHTFLKHHVEIPPPITITFPLVEPRKRLQG